MWNTVTTLLKDKLPFVLYRLPNTEELVLIAQNDSTLHFALSFKDEGFIFAPFDFKKKKVLLKPDTVLNFKVNLEPLANKVSSTKPNFDQETKERYKGLIANAISEIKNGKLNKVVLSRSITVNTKKSHSAIFQQLLSKYNQAFCYWFFHPEIGTWMGATPERLLGFTNNKLTTTALAGTIPVEDGKNPSWTNKEIEEQNMVTEFIEASLTPYCKELNISETKSYRAAHLWHLKTNIAAEIDGEEKLPLIIEGLHPTPAVCGLPKSLAQTFIATNEGYDREYYTGYLGSLNLEKDKLDLFVNLRCMQLKGNKATVYVGGGITESSVPEKEWEETVNKSLTMLAVL